jgi:2-polyprenyl-3-methyl-5-hydroxy-6-metoxy-1,4-benzoquinol methylase
MKMSFGFRQFARLGADNWRIQRSRLAALFIRTVGPLGMHARIRNAHVITELEKLDLEHCRIVDSGAGEGYVLFWLARRSPAAQLEGIDLDPRRVAACQHIVRAAGLANLSFRVGPADDLTPDPGYDIIVSVDVLEHVPDDVGVLHRMAAGLRPGGRLVLHLPLRHQLQRRILPAFRDHLIADHVRDEYTAEEISAKLAEAGFVVLSLRYGFGLWGELSFELNNLYWRHRALRNLTALLTLPIALPLGYLDVRQTLARGNSIVLVAALKSNTEDA